MEEILKNGFAQLGVEVSERALERYRIYFEYLEERNKVMNLTAISGTEDVARLHFLDCAALHGMYAPTGKRLIHVGTGAGLRGLPLKIAEPSLDLTLLDSRNKRVDFLGRPAKGSALRTLTASTQGRRRRRRSSAEPMTSPYPEPLRG